jgi:hypothetical protein
MAYNSILNEIKISIESFKEKLEDQLPALQQEIKILIESKCTDNNRIENMCDTLLSILDFGLGKKEFIQLLEYYKTVDADGAAFYWNEYDKEEE